MFAVYSLMGPLCTTFPYELFLLCACVVAYYMLPYVRVLQGSIILRKPFK